MITVSVIGGLGNQMFQYAAGKALAQRLGVDLVIDQGAFKSYELRQFLLDRLKIPEAEFSETVAAPTPGVSQFPKQKWIGRADRILARVGLGMPSKLGRIYTEPHYQFDPEFLKLEAPTSIFGYFQSEAYFPAIKADLRNYFQLREPLGSEASATADAIVGSELPISVHVRCGDYVESEETNRVHGVLGSDYYRRAFSIMEGLTGSRATIFAFSDDFDRAKAILDLVPKIRVIPVKGDPNRPWEDMTLMSLCRHHVIANSSFSWWGAWLNPSPEKIVVAPRTWFAPTELRRKNTCDLCPPEWILI